MFSAPRISTPRKLHRSDSQGPGHARRGQAQSEHHHHHIQHPAPHSHSHLRSRTSSAHPRPASAMSSGTYEHLHDFPRAFGGAHHHKPTLGERFPPRVRPTPVKPGRSKEMPFVPRRDDAAPWPRSPSVSSRRPWIVELDEDEDEELDSGIYARTHHTRDWAREQDHHDRRRERVMSSPSPPPTVLPPAWEREFIPDPFTRSRSPPPPSPSHHAFAHGYPFAEERRARVVQEEVRRIQIRIRERRDSESSRMKAARERMEKERHERERLERERFAKLVKDAWAKYEEGWAKLSAGEGEVEAKDIPWPLLSMRLEAGEPFAKCITTEGVARLLLSPAHTESQSPRERIRRALLRWHPDRFGRLLARVVDSDREQVREAVDVVAKCLNELLEEFKEDA